MCGLATYLNTCLLGGQHNHVHASRVQGLRHVWVLKSGSKRGTSSERYENMSSVSGVVVRLRCAAGC